MMHRINSKNVSDQEWATFVSDMETICHLDVREIAHDGEITNGEIFVLLNKNRDNIINAEDFENVKALCFVELDCFLKKYGFKVGQSVYSLWSNRDFVLKMVSEYGIALKYADVALRKDKEVVLAAVKQDGWALDYADALLKKDKDVVFAAVRQNWNVAQHLNVKVFKSLCDEIDWRPYFSPDEMKDRDTFITALQKKYDISFPNRFRSLHTLFEILKNRTRPISPDNKTCIIIYPKGRDSQIFDSYPTADRMVELGYRLAYYEADDEAELQSSLAKATSNGAYPADVIIIGGHGTATTLALGGPSLRYSNGKMKDESLYLDTSDLKPKDEINFGKYVKPSGDIVLVSCSNGKGGKENNENLSNMLATTVPKGVRVHSSTEPMLLQDVSRAADDRICVEWTESSLYVTNGRQQ